MATINPSQDYDIIHTLTYASSGGTNSIELYRGGYEAFSGTVYYRAGTSGAWTSLSVGGYATTFPIISTTMQIAHNWNKSGNDYMTPVFRGGTMTGIAISQKAALSGVMGHFFMSEYAYNCTNLTSLAVPDTSNITSVGGSFMYGYAYNCANLTSLDAPDTSSLTSAGDLFMQAYAYNCTSLTSLAVPDTSNITSVGYFFLADYARNCANLTSLDAPDTSSLTSVGTYFMQEYAYNCANLTSLDAPDTSGLTSVDVFMKAYAYNCTSLTSLAVPDTSNITSVGYFFLADYASYCTNLTSLAVPDTSNITSVGDNFMHGYASYCYRLTQLTLPAAGWFKTNNVDWNVPSGRLGLLKGKASNSTDTADWKALTISGKTLHTNYIRDSSLVWEPLPPTITTTTATAITNTTATLAGNVSSDGGVDITERGVVWATTASPTTANSKAIAAGTTGAFSVSATSLTPNTTYHYRAFATNSEGTSYGADKTFKTTFTLSATTGAVGTPALTTVTITGNAIANPDNLALTEYGVAYATTTSPVITDNKKTSVASQSNYPAALIGLAEGTTYYARAYVTFDGNTYYGSQVSFKTTGRPVTTLNTPAASGSVTELRPNLDFTGNDPDNNQITYQLQLNQTNSFTSPSLDVLSASNTGFTNRSDVKTDPFYSGNQIRYTLQTDLSRGSDYYWRVRGKDTNGSDSWGNWTTARKFTVAAIAPTVTITGVSDILDTSLKVNGTITDNGGATVTERGAVLSTTPNPTTANLKFTATGESFTASATGLTGSTTYYVRTYAINAAGTSYSTESTVMTLQPIEPPTLTVGDPTRLIDVSTQITATVTLDGTREVTERGIVFSTGTNPDTDDNIVTANTIGLGEYTLLLTGLLPETTYYYRAYAINDQGTGYSAQKSFTTLAPFVPDEGDGYWVFSVTDSDAIVSRSQATPANSSVSLPLADLGLEDGKTYTLAVGDFVSELGDLGMSLLYYDAANPVTTNVPENSQLTFTYNLTDYHTYILQLHVTGDDPVIEKLTATFKDLYLAEESTFSDFVPFTPYGLFEIKLENNQIVDKRRQGVIQSMYNRLEGWEITPFEVTTGGLGYFEIGDGITIKDPQDNDVKSYITEYTLTIDGGITEEFIGKRPPESKTDYSKAGNIKKLISNTTLQVDKQRQEIEALVQDVYDNDGYIEEKFTQVTQDINQVRTTVQGAGGVNLIRNSVMYAYNNLGYPEEWTTTHIGGEDSTIVIQGSAESKTAGGLSGHIFILNGTKVVQKVTVRKDADFITEENKTFYTFNIKVKKDLVGEAYIKLSNRQEEHIIDLPNGEEYLWEDFSIDGLLPQDDHYEIEIYSDSDANAQFTDAMLSVGEYTHSWTQAPGEAMNMVRSDTVDGTYWRSPQLRHNYTHISPLGMNVHQRIRGQEEEVFGFNADETNMSKVKATKQVSMGKVRIVPIEMNGTSGWAWTGAEE